MTRKIGCIWYYIIGNFFSLFIYDRKFLKGKHFEGKFKGVCSVGWKWVVRDCISRIFFGVNKGIPFPVSPKIIIINPKNIIFDINDLNNFHGSGNYFQASEDCNIIIGKGSWIGPNVGIITANHDVNNPEFHTKCKSVIIGEKCWIGMNSVILPGVKLGPHITVGAGSIVTKSFNSGYCIIAGNPAKIIKQLDREI